MGKVARSISSLFSFRWTWREGSTPFSRRRARTTEWISCGTASIPADPIRSQACAPTRAFSAYSATRLLKMLPEQTKRMLVISYPSCDTMPAMQRPTLSPSTTPLHPASRTDETEKLETRLCRLVGQAIADYRMIEDGDKVMVCLSGGKDSYGLLEILLSLRSRAPVHFDIIAVNLDQKQPGFPAHVLPEYLTRHGVPFHIETRDTYSIVKRLIPEGQTTCSLCSRLRRGHLYRLATELSATKIALGHHRDDILETLLLNLFFTGKLKAMPPKLRSKSGRHMVIRPLAYVKEADLARYAALLQFPIIPCDLCGSQEDLKRKQVKVLLREWNERFPGSNDSLFAALSNVAPPLLLDRRLFDFSSLRTDVGAAESGGNDAEDELPYTASGRGLA